MIIDFDIIGVITCFVIWCVTISFLLFVKKVNKLYALFFTLMYVYLCMVIERTQFPIYCLPGMKQIYKEMYMEENIANKCMFWDIYRIMSVCYCAGDGNDASSGGY